MKSAKQNQFRFLLAGTAAGGMVSAMSVSVMAESVRPNILLLMTDEHSPHVLRCYGNQIIQTPTLDALAESGVRFNNTYCQNPISVPSRASFLTGRMPSHVGVFNNDADDKQTLKDEPVTFANIFKAAGYSVEWLGKTHWGAKNDDLGFGKLNNALQKRNKIKEYIDLRNELGRLPHDARPYDFSEMLDEDSIVVDEAIKFLENYSGEPFFLGVSLKNPHFPFMCQRKYYDLYKDTVDMPYVTQEMIDS